MQPSGASRLIVLGPPGGGKGTHAERLAREIGVPHIATGDMLRREVAEGTALGRRAKGFMDAGLLVPDDVITETTLRRLAHPDARAGWILDGFPRTLRQAQDLDAGLMSRGVELVLVLEVPDDEVFDRIAGRRTCPHGHVFHLARNPPAEPGVCDVDGLPLTQREDAAEEIIRERLNIYEQGSAPLFDHYDKRGILRRLDGMGSVDEVYDRLLRALEKGEFPTLTGIRWMHAESGKEAGGGIRGAGQAPIGGSSFTPPSRWEAP
jgi:adenylate kinase